MLDSAQLNGISSKLKDASKTLHTSVFFGDKWNEYVKNFQTTVADFIDIKFKKFISQKNNDDMMALEKLNSDLEDLIDKAEHLNTLDNGCPKLTLAIYEYHHMIRNEKNALQKKLNDKNIHLVDDNSLKNLNEKLSANVANLTGRLDLQTKQLDGYKNEFRKLNANAIKFFSETKMLRKIADMGPQQYPLVIDQLKVITDDHHQMMITEPSISPPKIANSR